MSNRGSSSNDGWKETARRRLRRLRDPLGVLHQLRTHPRGEAEYRARVHRSVESNNLLEELAVEHSGQPFTKSWHYFEFYASRLHDVAMASRCGSSGEPLRVLEIGVWQAGSLQLWRKFFGESAVIYGVDIDEQCLSRPDPQAEIRIGSQTDESFLVSVIEEMGGVDVVIDDGSHQCDHVIESFEILFPLLNEGGFYFVEDLHTSYWPQWKGGLRRSGTSIEFLKQLADAVNADYFRASPIKGHAGFDPRDICSVEFVDSVALVRKRQHEEARIFYGGKHDPAYLEFWGVDSAPGWTGD